MKKKFAVLVLCGVLLSACAEDKTVDEYQRERLQQNLALYQAVSGRYTGKVNSTLDKSPLGAMEIELRSETVVNSGGSGESSIGTPILVTNIRFLDQNVIALSAHNSFYDPNTGAFSAQIQIKRSEIGETQVVSISGTLVSDVLSGQISAVDYIGFGGSFSLIKNGPPLLSFAPDSRPDQGDVDQGARRVQTYTGVTRFLAGPEKPVQIVVLQPLRGTSEDFLDLITPVKTVQVSFNYSQSLHIQYSNAIFDIEQGLLTGRTSVTVNEQIQPFTLECQITTDKQLNCRHLTTGAGLTASSVAQLATGPTQAPPEDPNERLSVTKIFVGKGKLDEKIVPMNLTVTLPSRGRLSDLLELFFPNSEKFLDIGLMFSDAASAAFTDVKWSSINGRLEGIVNRAVGGTGYTAYIRCRDFYFTETRNPFTCDYWTTRSPMITIQFEAPLIN